MMLKPVFLIAILSVIMIGILVPNVFSEESKNILVNSGKISVNDFLYKPFDIITADLKSNSFECADNVVSVSTNKQYYAIKDVVTIKAKITSESNERDIKLKSL